MLILMIIEMVPNALPQREGPGTDPANIDVVFGAELHFSNIDGCGFCTKAIRPPTFYSLKYSRDACRQEAASPGNTFSWKAAIHAVQKLFSNIEAAKCRPLRLPLLGCMCGVEPPLKFSRGWYINCSLEQNTEL
ncbi:hypothetical protein AVEN_105614-1 [Araneus ventricosus]|uniref:Uncharacterized protein n=1 Tax=Araneus ventricosus TaxID=182803 RepID=A0A4Y2W8T7_ARAVE|nr:hypothetical protein AVEN_105614-1 [Araneus ventricosus]